MRKIEKVGTEKNELSKVSERKKKKRERERECKEERKKEESRNSPKIWDLKKFENLRRRETALEFVKIRESVPSLRLKET